MLVDGGNKVIARGGHVTAGSTAGARQWRQ